MRVTELELPGALLIEPEIRRDGRGWFLETWHAERYRAAGLTGGFLQDNASFSRQGVLRGLHFQHPYGQAKLISVLQGEVYDVIVDIRVGSPTFGRWLGMSLSADAGLQLYVPAGFAHGFLVTSPTALFTYKCSELYRPDADRVVYWADPALGIRWPLEEPFLSDRDRAAPSLAEIPREQLPSWASA